MHLVSEAFRYGGTPDLVATDHNGRLCLLDWKCANRVYQDYLIQLAAYRQIWNENRERKLERFHLLRVGKESASFEHRMWSPQDLDVGWEMFKHLRAAYELDKRLKKVAAV